MARRKTLGTSPAARIKYGSDVAAIRGKMTRKQWQLVVKTAKRRGLTTRGVLQDVPAASMRERSSAGIAREAQRRAASVYNPQRGQLSLATAQATALADKRKTDLQRYNQWLADQQASLMSGARAADAIVAERISRIQADSRDAWQAQQRTAMANAQQTPGNVSNPQDSSAMKMLAEAAANQQSRIATQGAASVGQSANQLGMMNVAASALLGATAADEVKRQSDLNQSMTDIRQAGLKLTADQAAAVDQLKDTLSQRNDQNQARLMEFGAAAEKLGLEAAKLKFQVSTTKKKLQLEGKKLNLSRWVARNQNLAEKAKLQLGYDQIAATQGTAAADRALKRWVEKYQAKHGTGDGGKGGPTADERKASRETFRTVQSVRGQIRQLYKEAGGKGTVQHGPNKGKDFRTILRQRGYDEPTINLAFDLQRNNGRISPGGIRTAKNLGILHPLALWQPSRRR